MKDSPSSFDQNTLMPNQIIKADLWLNYVGFNNILLIFRIIVFGLLMNYKDWYLKLLVNNLRH
jgi:hypothetical protein